MYGAHTNYIVIDEPLDFFGVVLMVARKRNWVCMDVNPINHSKLAEVTAGKDRTIEFCNRVRHYYKWHFADPPNTLQQMSEEAVLNVDDLYR